jgi:hypothetical protein
MEAFDYLSVLVSIILGLGITQLLSGFGTWLEQRQSFRAYGPAIAWAGFLLLVHVQTWWTMYGMRGFDSWNFLQFAVVLLQPIILYLLAVIVLPGPNAPQNDPRANFHMQRRWFFGLLMGIVVVSLLKDASRFELPDAANIGFHAIFFAIALIGFFSAREGVQRALAFGSFAAFGIYIALLFAEL